MYRNTESHAMVKQILLSSKPRTNAVKTREEGEILLVMNPGQSLLFLNLVAKDFFLLCNGENTLDDIVEILYNQYDVEKETLTDDLLDIIQDMQKKRILYFDPLEAKLWMNSKSD